MGSGMSSCGLNGLSALVFALLCFSGTAYGDWQGTVWNNSPEQAEQDFRVPHRAATPAGSKTISAKLELPSIATK